jgi:hypothetical protein
MSAPELRPLPPWLHRRGLLALGLTLIGAPALLLLRNLASDHVAYTRARASGRASEYRAYLGDGRVHAGRARAELPGIAFAEARRAGKAEGFGSFVREFPDSPDKPEALSLLYRASLDEAKRAQNAAALRGYLRAYPDSPHREEAQAALHDRYAAALDAFRRQASRSNPDVVAFVERLVRYLEASGAASVRMIFESPSNERLEAVDRDIKTRSTRIVPIAEHFGPKSTGRMQQAIVGLLSKGFASVFPADVLTISDKPAAAGSVGPEFLIRYEVQASGTTYQSTTNMFAPSYVGIRILFRTAFSVPNDPRPLQLSFAVEPPSNFTVHYTTSSRFGLEQPSDDAVYSTMCERAFDDLATRLPAAFFAQGSAALQAAATFTAKP